jgi:hypothetical protein
MRRGYACLAGRRGWTAELIGEARKKKEKKTRTRERKCGEGVM